MSYNIFHKNSSTFWARQTAGFYRSLNIFFILGNDEFRIFYIALDFFFRLSKLERNGETLFYTCMFQEPINFLCAYRMVKKEYLIV
jgi:hypothetical protein